MDIELNKPYNFKEEIWPKLKITLYQWTERKEDLLNWLNDFFDYKLITSVIPNQIIFYEIYGEYEPLPRKNVKTTEEKKKDYKKYVINSINEHPYNTTSNLARNAKELQIKYNHKEAASAKYIRPIVNDNNLIHKNERVWVKFVDDHYEPLTIEEEEFIHECMHRSFNSAEDSKTLESWSSAYHTKDMTRAEYNDCVGTLRYNQFIFALEEFSKKYLFQPIKVPYLTVNAFAAGSQE